MRLVRLAVAALVGLVVLVAGPPAAAYWSYSRVCYGQGVCHHELVWIEEGTSSSGGGGGGGSSSGGGGGAAPPTCNAPPPWGCLEGRPGQGAPPTVSGYAVALMVADDLSVPVPSGGKYPDGVLADGRAYTTVNTHMWFWVDPAAWAPVSSSLSLGGVTSTLTATPTSLWFDPGNGAGRVSCVGPGSVYPVSQGGWPGPSPSGCEYVYEQTSASVTATWGITWSVTWSSSTGESGSMPDMTSSTSQSFMVAEVQSVVTD